MYDDVEADFWKEKLVELLRENMSRRDAGRLCVQNASEEIKKFEEKFPQWKGESVFAANYVTWETFVTKSVKIRLFIQNQIKVTLLQKSDDDLVKIADGKFAVNPFVEIASFLEKKEKYEVELKELVVENQKYLKKQKITGEIIKALLKKQFDGKLDFVLELERKDFCLTVFVGEKEEKYKISMENFKEDVKKVGSKALRECVPQRG